MKTEHLSAATNSSDPIWASNVELLPPEECLPVIGSCQVSSILQNLDSVPQIDTHSLQNMDLIILNGTDYKPLTETPLNYIILKDTNNQHVEETRAKSKPPDHTQRTEILQKPENIEDILYFVCNLCPFLSTKDSKITEHIETAHKNKSLRTPLSDFKCPACTNIFHHRSSLKFHLIYDHYVAGDELDLILEAVLYYSNRDKTDQQNKSLEAREEASKNSVNPSSIVEVSDSSETDKEPEYTKLTRYMPRLTPSKMLDHDSSSNCSNSNSTEYFEIHSPGDRPPSVLESTPKKPKLLQQNVVKHPIVSKQLILPSVVPSLVEWDPINKSNLETHKGIIAPSLAPPRMSFHPPQKFILSSSPPLLPQATTNSLHISFSPCKTQPTLTPSNRFLPMRTRPSSYLVGNNAPPLESLKSPLTVSTLVPETLRSSLTVTSSVSNSVGASSLSTMNMGISHAQTTNVQANSSSVMAISRKKVALPQVDITPKNGEMLFADNGSSSSAVKNNDVKKKISATLTQFCPGKQCIISTCKVRMNDVTKLNYHIGCHTDEGFKCMECQEKFILWKPLTSHLWRFHKIDMELYSCNECDYKTFSLAKLNNVHKLTHGEAKNFLCDLCQKSFKNPKQLNNHKERHKEKPEKPPLKCEICHKSYTDKRTLKTHMDSVHKKLKPFLCSYCGYKGSSRCGLKMHMRSQHTGERPFSCEQCPYTTSDHNSLRRHKLRHTGQKPYKCKYCSYACIQSSTYKAHLKTKHPGFETELMFTCHQCQFKTVNKDIYTSHLFTAHQVEPSTDLLPNR